MDDILNRPIVLVLNRNWQAINVRTPQQAFVQMATDVATALNIDGGNMVPARWAEWIKLPVRENDYSVRTPSGPIRVPSVIVLSRFAKVPKRRPKFSARAIWARDGGECQYAGANLRPREGNIDHVLPRSRGGKMSWENCVLASKDVNSRKADRLPEEVACACSSHRRHPGNCPVRSSSGTSTASRRGSTSSSSKRWGPFFGNGPSRDCLAQIED